MYNYSPFDFISIFHLSTNTNETRIVKDTLQMKYKESQRLTIDEEIDTLSNNDT